MKTLLRPRYYCDYCKKSGGSKYYMQKHEEACTANSDRYCNMCALVDGGYDSDNFWDLLNVLNQGIQVQGRGFDHHSGIEVGTFSDATKNKLAEIVNGCPVCIFAALRQTDTLWRWGESDWKERFDEQFNERMDEIHQESLTMVGYVG